MEDNNKRTVLFGNPRPLSEEELKSIDEQTRKDGKHDAVLGLLEKTHRSRQEDAELSDLTTE